MKPTAPTKLTEDEIKKMQYFSLHQDRPLSSREKLLNSYLKYYWIQNWTTYLREELRSNDIVGEDEYNRQNRVTAVMYNNEVVGMHLIGTYKQSDLRTHPYFAQYDEAFIADLEKRNVKNIMALQYLWVDSKWPRKRAGIHFSALMCSLSLRHHIRDNVDVTVSIARKDIIAHEIAKRVGFQEFGDVRQMHNVPVIQMAVFNPTPYPDASLENWADYFWSHKSETLTTPTEMEKVSA